jgi:hypothetical protein
MVTAQTTSEYEVVGNPTDAAVWIWIDRSEEQ